MIDWSKISGFDWDSGNASKNVVRHQVHGAEAEQMFANQPLLISRDETHSVLESRFQALGRSNAGRLLFAAFTLREENSLIRIISVRDMNRKERVQYAQTP